MNEQALKDRLQTIAQEKQIKFNSCWKQLLLERFLSRLARSAFSSKFIFKGGFLLSYMLKIGRETTDLDFLLTHMQAEANEIQKAFEDIVSSPGNDGFSFSYQSMSPLTQPHMNYPGYRTTLQAIFGKMRDKIHVDVGVGDAVQPHNLHIQLFRYRGQPMFENEISLLVYPLETIFAEKLETVISKGAANSRMKDYHDLFLLARDNKLPDRKKLRESLVQTFQNRGTSLQPIEFDQSGLNSLQKLWTAHMTGLGDIAQKLLLPHDISDVIPIINALF